ncbi:MAG: HTTM domain-containing protein [Myxococcota bacterium]|nr:HTTM domain-containing protein [Myxococcota bacterium]
MAVLGPPSWLRPVDIAGLVWFRVCFGSIMVWEVCRYLAYGRVYAYYIEPDFHFSYHGFQWLIPLPGYGMIALFIGLGVAAVGITLGAYYRLATTLFFLGFTYAFLLEQATYLNHLYLVCLLSFIMIVLPAHRSMSVDAWRDPSLRTDRVEAWTIWLLRAQIGAVYFFGGVAKLNADWLAGMPLLAWMDTRADWAVIGGLLAWDGTAWFMAYAGLLLDLLALPLLLIRRTRGHALVAVMVFHLCNELLFSIGIFPYLMVGASLIYLEPDWPRRVLSSIVPADRHRVHLPQQTRARRVGLRLLLGGWLAVQVFLPLRHHLYPGNPSWTEEGHLLAWHMKLRSKVSRAAFTLTDTVTGVRYPIETTPLLTERQHRKMVTRPELIRQFAHYLEDRYIAQTDGTRRPEDVVVTARIRAGLNGRRLQPLIKSTVDLTELQSEVWPPADWIVPLTMPLERP